MPENGDNGETEEELDESEKQIDGIKDGDPDATTGDEKLDDVLRLMRDRKIK